MWHSPISFMAGNETCEGKYLQPKADVPPVSVQLANREKAEWLYPMERVSSGSGRNISAQGVSSLVAYWNPLGSILKTLMPKNPHGSESLGSCRFWKLPCGFWCTARLNIAITEQKRLAPFKRHHRGDRQFGPRLAACSGCPSQTLVTGQKTIWLKVC